MRGFLHDVSAWLQQHFMAIEIVTWAIALAVLAYSGLQYYSLSQEYALAKEELSSTSAAYTKITIAWQDKFEQAVGQNQALAQNLTDARNQNDQFQAQINGVKGSIDQLVKLSATDKELLQKYSKVYFLNENYIPSSLSVIPVKYNADPTRELEFHSNALPALKDLLDAANAATGTSLKVVSAYRSFGTQSSLKNDYAQSFGTGANKFSADQGYSEHQLGTAVDLAPTDGKNTLTLSFASTTQSAWLQQNAYKYGFVLSYPKGNAYYIYEPWHWRFVGTALATRLHNDGKNFYDLDQRDIDGYLALIFN